MAADGARDALVEANLGLVYREAARVAGHAGSCDFSDMISDGFVGLLRAAERWDPGAGHAPSTYLVPRIRWAIADGLRDRDIASRGLRTAGRKLTRARRVIAQALEREATAPELAVELKMTAEAVNSLRDRLAAASHAAPIEAADGRVDFPDPSVRALAVVTVERLLAELGGRESFVLSAHDLFGYRLREIADHLGVTESRVSQIRSTAIRKLRERPACG